MHNPHASFPLHSWMKLISQHPKMCFSIILIIILTTIYENTLLMVLQLTLQILGKTWVVNHKFTWSSHYNHICCKACRLLNLIRHIVSPLKKRLYNSLVRSNSTYRSQLWRPQLVRTLWLKWVTKWFQRCLWRKDLTKMRDKNIKFWKFSLNRHTNGKLWV